MTTHSKAKSIWSRTILFWHKISRCKMGSSHKMKCWGVKAASTNSQNKTYWMNQAKFRMTSEWSETNGTSTDDTMCMFHLYEVKKIGEQNEWLLHISTIEDIHQISNITMEEKVGKIKFKFTFSGVCILEIYCIWLFDIFFLSTGYWIIERNFRLDPNLERLIDLARQIIIWIS